MPDRTERPSGFFRLRPFDLDLGDVIAQIVAVALGVMLGFAATAWSERNHQRALLRETVANIVDELSSNKDGMSHVTAEHAKAAAALLTLAKGSAKSGHISLADARNAVREVGKMRVNVPLAIAWQIAQNDQGLTLLPYQDRYSLAWVYEVQTIYYQKQERFENSMLTLSESPSGNYFFQIADLANQMASVVNTEQQLDDLYAKAIQCAKTEFKT
jgi:hypothetical protein